MVVQAVVDYRYRFMNVYTGWPGSVHDARVFAHFSLYKLGTKTSCFQTQERYRSTVYPKYFEGGKFSLILRFWVLSVKILPLKYLDLHIV